ncbi:glycosyltransferase family 4 protein [archaeon]|jgi:glycosyltransferase involved in cell wall biosynthesis|nr:glycosyltransferase family 4 protein [archaeon]MBT6761810.1 glycosyltransferase family 4 protein [archaeon]
MKITYICPTNCVRRPIAELAILLSKKGHEVSVAYPYSKECPTDHWAPNKKILDYKNVKNVHISSYYLSSLPYNFVKPMSMLRHVREIFKADVVHLWEYWYPICMFIIFYALVTGQRKKLIMTTDGLVGYSYVPKDPWWAVPVFKVYTKTIGQILFRIPGKLTTYGNAMLSHAKKAGMPMKKLMVQGTGIHLDKFQHVSEEKVNDLREEFSVESDEKVLLFVGMLTERKGVKTVIEVGIRLLDTGKKIKVLLVGSTDDKLFYKKLVPKKYSKKIVFVGGRTDIPVWMNLADVLLLPSEGEGLPGVVMEAMASGTACVATNEGCTPDLIDSGTNGFLVEHADVASYTDAVKQVLDDSKKFGDAAYEKIKNFGWEKVAKEYLEIYNKEV